MTPANRIACDNGGRCRKKQNPLAANTDATLIICRAPRFAFGDRFRLIGLSWGSGYFSSSMMVGWDSW